jgi:hypothetical protein
VGHANKFLGGGLGIKICGPHYSAVHTILGTHTNKQIGCSEKTRSEIRSTLHLEKVYTRQQHPKFWRKREISTDTYIGTYKASRHDALVSLTSSPIGVLALKTLTTGSQQTFRGACVDSGAQKAVVGQHQVRSHSRFNGITFRLPPSKEAFVLVQEDKNRWERYFSAFHSAMIALSTKLLA